MGIKYATNFVNIDKAIDILSQSYSFVSKQTLVNIVEKLKEFNSQLFYKNKKQVVENYKYVESKNTFALQTMLFGMIKSFEKLQKLSPDQKVIFVSTGNKDVGEFVKQQAKANNQFYVIKRWLGGTMTNFKTVQRSINDYNKLEELMKSDNKQYFTKKEISAKQKQLDKYESVLGGIKEIKGIPKVMVVVEPFTEKNAINEAKKMKIDIVALCSINAKTNGISYTIPCNTKSKKTVWLILAFLFDALNLKNSNPLNILNKQKIITPDFINSINNK